MDRDSPTRRDVVKYGGSMLTAGLLAGCTGDGTASPSTTDADTSSGPTSQTTTDGSYTVTMEPVGAVEFDSPPETWVPYTADYADMGVALGHGDGLAAIGVKARYATHLYEDLPGVSVDTDGLTELWQNGTGKEIYYELDADVHVTDPNFMVNRLQWSEGDVEEISEGVAPFFGNTIFSRAYGWHDDYQYYSLYEAFEKLAQLFQERARYEAFASLHEKVLADVEQRLPDETPDIALLYPAELPPESFYPYLVGGGTQSKHWNDLGVGDALAEHGVTDAQAGGGAIDFETLLEIDPDALAIRLQGEISESYFEENIRSHLENHDAASQLSAVQNDRVVYGGLTYQGPIVHLFQLEQAAQGLYPEEFGGEQLFDRQRVANIVHGEFQA
ncbi:MULTISPECIES: ABC transporter substrate-binding protein [Halobacterium]|uniref:ABC transporter substrate-binding protein n=1 Tax=Halobacterium TaxID=2239 RepID=UPI00073EBC27|nr:MULTISPECIES: ABC transporter substrate-binding protein [Halobacterium]MCG1003210.1 ABC transporter substrate-binding protein [Halobacterium noricense]